MANETVAAWRAGTERGNAQAAAECLAGDVTVFLPLTGNYRFHGREPMRRMLEAAFELITELRYETDVGDGNLYALFYRARIASETVAEAQLLRLDSDSLIYELTLVGRPPQVFVDAMERIGPRLVGGPPRVGQARRFAFHDLHVETAALASRGIMVGEVTTTAKNAKLASVADPDGNTITLIENPSS